MSPLERSLPRRSWESRILLKDGRATSAELARLTGTRQGSLYRLLRAVASAGILVESPTDRFALTPLGQTLRSDLPESMRAIARMAGRFRAEPWIEIVHSVRTGQTAFQKVHGASLYEYLSSYREEGAVFAAAMTCLSKLDASAVAAAYDFSGIKTAVDVGGGQGTFLAEIIRSKPSIRGIVFDRPAVVEQAKGYLAHGGLSDRITLMPGDFFENVPEGCDLYIVKNVLMDWEDSYVVRILINCRRASKGLGKAIATELAQEGADVSICARWKENLDEAATALRKYDVKVVTTAADVSHATDVQQVVDATLKALGRIDILVNNAGEAWLGRSFETTDQPLQCSALHPQCRAANARPRGRADY
jgi:hypothetical protein